MVPGWVRNGKKGYIHTSHHTPNTVFPKNEILNSQSPNTLSKPKEQLTGLHKILQKFIFYWN